MGSVAARIVPSLLDGQRNVIQTAWDRLRKVPGGARLFSRLVGTAAPYTGTIDARVVELRDGYSRVEMGDHRKVRNHLRCVHAIALANLVEVTGNIALAYSLPDDARFIVTGMELSYLKKARGKITGICECPPVSSSERAELDIPVTLLDGAGDEVVRATLRSLVGPKKG